MFKIIFPGGVNQVILQCLKKKEASCLTLTVIAQESRKTSLTVHASCSIAMAESVSLNQIMAGAGLTHGGFYSYFKSKSDLYAEVLGCFFTDPQWKSCWEGVHVDL